MSKRLAKLEAMGFRIACTDRRVVMGENGPAREPGERLIMCRVIRARGA